MAKNSDFMAAAALTLSIVAILAVAWFASYAMQTHVVGSSASHVTVSASGTAYGYPDQAVIYFVVNGTGKSSAAAYSNLSATLAIVNRSLSRYLNGNLSAIKTVYYNSYVIYNTTIHSQQEELSVTLSNASNVTPVLGVLSLENNLRVQDVQVQFSSAQFNNLLSSALGKAITNATQQAQAVASGRTVTLENVSIDSYQYYPLEINRVGAAGTISNTSFFTGTSSVVRTIYATFRIE